MEIKSTVRFKLALDVEVNSTGKHTLSFDHVQAEAIRAAEKKLAEMLSGFEDLSVCDAPRVVHLVTVGES